MGDFEALELTPFSGRPLNICQISVENENDSIIGRNSELVQYRSIKTKIKKKEWVVNSIKSALESFGVQSVSECEGTTIRCTITKMWVEEGSVYKADFLMKVSVEKDDSTLWAGIVADSSNRWGRSMSCALYNETLSNALLGSVYKLLSNTNFQIAIQK